MTTDSIQIPDFLRLPILSAEDEGRYAVAKAENGLQFMLPPAYLEYVLKDQALNDKIEELAERIINIEETTGKKFDRPVFLTASQSHLGFSTGLIPRKQMREMFGKKAARDLKQGISTGDSKEDYAVLNVPLVSLMENSPLSMDDIGGIIMHELGHAASRDSISLQRQGALWFESLQKIDQMCILVQAKPELTAHITEEIGGNEAFLQEAEKLFRKVSGEFQKLVDTASTKHGSFDVFSSETVLDHLYHDETFMAQYDKVAKLGTGDTMAEFDKLHDVTVNLLCEGIKKHVKIQNGLVSSPERGRMFQTFNALTQHFNHAHEFFADDFATRNHKSPTSYLNKLTPHGDGDSHPATKRRVMRADKLDDERVGQLVEHETIDEHGATKATNEYMVTIGNRQYERGEQLAQMKAQRELIKSKQKAAQNTEKGGISSFRKKVEESRQRSVGGLSIAS